MVTICRLDTILLTCQNVHLAAYTTAVSALLLHSPQLPRLSFGLKSNHNTMVVIYNFVLVKSSYKNQLTIASRLQRVSLIVIPFSLSVCRSFRDLQPTTIDR